jgi:hypothetical protein
MVVRQYSARSGTLRGAERGQIDERGTEDRGRTDCPMRLEAIADHQTVPCSDCSEVDCRQLDSLSHGHHLVEGSDAVNMNESAVVVVVTRGLSDDDSHLQPGDGQIANHTA